MFNAPSELTQRHQKRHALALTHDETNSSLRLDMVKAFQCSSWPAFCSEWLTRNRSANWPSQKIIDICKDFGCLFVPVGHPISDEQDLLWRASLSRQVRLFITNFNSVQLKCYILLNIIKKELIAPRIPDSLSSYHLKTCMLFLMESTTLSIWKPDNLLVYL